MKERGKGVEIYNNNEFCSSSSDVVPCKKHPSSSSSVGICAYCLKDRLAKLVCSDCGEQRLSSCSCSSEISSNRNSSSCNVDVGSVGRISFLLENDNQNVITTSSKPKSRAAAAEEVFLLKRSSSSCVEIKRKNGFWRIGRLFRKKREKDKSGVNGVDEKSSDLWVVDYMGGVSRSRSLCSFRGGGFFGSEDGGTTDYRSSMSAARSSSVFDAERKSGFSEPRKSGFDSEKRDSNSVLESDGGGNGSDFKSVRKGGVFSLKESYFTGADDSSFIDLKFDFSSETTKPELGKIGVLSDTTTNSAFGSMRGSGGDFVAHECGIGDLNHGGSCRITVSDIGIKKSRKSFKGWRWIFRQHHQSARKKDDEHLMVKP